MFTRPFHPDHFLRSVYGTEAFADYCRERRIPFAQTAGASPQAGDVRRWAAALAQLPQDLHAQVELELATVNEMAGSEAVAHLIEAAGDGQLPPDTVPRGAALSLWFFVHHHAHFQEVFHHHEIRDVESWRTAQAPPGFALADLHGKARALADALGTFFKVREGAGRFCRVETHRLAAATCFVCRVADRLQFLEAFTDGGRTTRHRLRRALPVLFVYYPADGTVLLKCHLRSKDRAAELFGHFGRAVLGCAVAYGDDAFRLDLLKRPFHPLPDAHDAELIRVKALHLHHPERAGRRRLKLETLSSDGPDAIDQLLQSHVEASALEQLRVCYAEIQVRVRVAGRPKNYVIRLWRERSNLSQSPLGDRFRGCLRRWGLTHAQP